MKIVVSREAVSDIQRLHDFLENKNSRAARRAITAIGEAIQTLEHLPARGRASGIAGIREIFVPFGNSSYVIRYAHVSDEEIIVVLRVWHGREGR